MGFPVKGLVGAFLVVDLLPVIEGLLAMAMVTPKAFAAEHFGLQRGGGNALLCPESGDGGHTPVDQFNTQTHQPDLDFGSAGLLAVVIQTGAPRVTVVAEYLAWQAAVAAEGLPQTRE